MSTTVICTSNFIELGEALKLDTVKVGKEIKAQSHCAKLQVGKLDAELLHITNNGNVPQIKVAKLARENLKTIVTDLTHGMWQFKLKN